MTAAAAASSGIKDEHLRPVKGTLRADAIPNQLPAGPQPSVPGTASRARLAAASDPNAFLTLPYVGWHSVTSIFDHCNPDCTTDAKVCRFDGAIGWKTNGVVPSFALGYARSPGGSGYLYFYRHTGMDAAVACDHSYAAAHWVA